VIRPEIPVAKRVNKSFLPGHKKPVSRTGFLMPKKLMHLFRCLMSLRNM